MLKAFLLRSLRPYILESELAALVIGSNMAAIFLFCQNAGAILGFLQGLDWLRKQGHTDKPVSAQLAAINSAIANNPDSLKKIVNSGGSPTDSKAEPGNGSP